MKKVDFGSVVLSVPEGSKLRLTFGPGEVLLAVALLCKFGEVEVRAYAAPRLGRADVGGQWRPMLTDFAEELRAQGLRLFFQDGPWGRELLAVGGGVFRTLIGRDGDRWTLVAVSAGPNDEAAWLTSFAREVLAETEVRRGEEPHPVRSLLPLRVVDETELGEWERVDFAELAEQGEDEQELFRPRFPDPNAPGARGSAMQQLRQLQSQN